MCGANYLGNEWGSSTSRLISTMKRKTTSRIHIYTFYCVSVLKCNHVHNVKVQQHNHTTISKITTTFAMYSTYIFCIVQHMYVSLLNVLAHTAVILCNVLIAYTRKICLRFCSGVPLDIIYITIISSRKVIWPSRSLSYM